MILKIIGTIALWFIAGFVINLFCYGDKPAHMLGKSSTAKTLHIIVNIITVMTLMGIILN